MVSVIIPAYNEGKHLLKLIDILKQVKSITEIILVDDCSKDVYSKTYKEIKGIRLLQHTKNKGKAASIYDGYLVAKSENLLFLDADLQGLTVKMVEELIEFSSSYDVVSIVRGGDYAITKLIGNTYITLGERYIRRSIVEQNEAQLFDNTRWGFDNNINDLLVTGKYKYAYCELAGVNHILKSHKYGLIRGMWDDLVMGFQVIVVKYKVFKFFQYRLKFWRKIQTRKIIHP